jgi:hypothetical protein
MLNVTSFTLTSPSLGSHVGIIDRDEGRSTQKGRKDINTWIHRLAQMLLGENIYIYIYEGKVIPVTNRGGP